MRRTLFALFARQRFTGLEVGKPEADEDTPGKVYVYFTAMVREGRAAGLVLRREKRARE